PNDFLDVLSDQELPLQSRSAEITIPDTATEELELELPTQSRSEEIIIPDTTSEGFDPLEPPSIRKPKYEIIETRYDTNLCMTLPIKVTIGELTYVHRSENCWARMTCTQGKLYICRFCGDRINASEPHLAVLSHLLGESYYRKKQQIRVSTYSRPVPCAFTTPAMIKKAKDELAELKQPSAPPPMHQIQLPSIQPPELSSSSSQASLSWITRPALLGMATILVSQKCLPFSLFDSPQFRCFVEASNEVSRTRGQRQAPITSYELRKYVVNSYEETKQEITRLLSASKGSIHVSVDSCTFNSIKNIHNIMASDHQFDWHIGHVSIPDLRAKDTEAYCALYQIAIQRVFSCSTPAANSQILPSSSSSDSSSTQSLSPPVRSAWQRSLSHIPLQPRQYEESSRYFSGKIGTLTVDGAPVNAAALQSLRKPHPEIIGLLCSVHGLNLLMNHFVKKTIWMSTTL
ncbi:MAG: hypothetical protein OJI67_05425, partial [Prosthecobacter sp.]|nr:hypothetical protein [Prosthecobacter sp.]